LSDTSVTVYVVGEFKQGKSSLINGLITAPVCPVWRSVNAPGSRANPYTTPAKADTSWKTGDSQVLSSH
jgi:ribosome biogenesis GTPase A